MVQLPNAEIAGPVGRTKSFLAPNVKRRLIYTSIKAADVLTVLSKNVPLRLLILVNVRLQLRCARLPAKILLNGSLS